MTIRLNPFTGSLDLIGIQGPSSSTNQAIVTWNGTSGSLVQDNPQTTIETGGAILAPGFITNRDVSTDISIPSKYSWIAPNLTIELTGSIEIEADAELIIV